MDRPRTIEELKQEIRRRAGRARPFLHHTAEEVKTALARLPQNDPDTWASAWSSLARPHEEAAAAHQAAGRHAQSRDSYMKAVWSYAAARWPRQNSAGKREAYRLVGANYVAAGRYFDPLLERVEIPFSGRASEGARIVAYFRRPKSASRSPVVVACGGIDSTKEERHEPAERFLERGLAVIAVEMPGTGGSPILASPGGHRQFSAVLDWIASRDDLDRNRVGFLGSSFGGYWATSLAHREPERLRASVNWGGGIHGFFQPEWNHRSRYADSYLFELLETRASALGLKTAEEYIEAAPALSLLDQGTLGGPCCPILLVNGKADQQVPIADLHLLLEHGEPKTARVFPGGHMGEGPVQEVVLSWLVRRLS
jgi:esterase FrsA